MDKLVLITDALEYIEANLTEDISTEDIAANLYCSKSSIEKLFRFVTNMSIKDYSIRRRMSKAAKELTMGTEGSLLELGIKYGYSSNEAFTRAFKAVWHVNPSEYKKNPSNFELFPGLKLEKELMEDKNMTSRKKVDISELYDLLRERRNCYFVGVDVRNLTAINEISTEAGDITIIKGLNRLEEEAGAEDLVFRVGGDEFVIMTNSEDSAYADELAARIKARNGETFKYGDKDISVCLRITSGRFEKKFVRYSDLFAELQKKIECAQ